MNNSFRGGFKAFSKQAFNKTFSNSFFKSRYSMNFTKANSNTQKSFINFSNNNFMAKVNDLSVKSYSNTSLSNMELVSGVFESSSDLSEMESNLTGGETNKVLVVIGDICRMTSDCKWIARTRLASGPHVVCTGNTD